MYSLFAAETIRKYPALPILNRECTIDYPLPDSNLLIEKGTMVIISLMGIARDPAYFPEPMLYRPERFSDDPPAYNVDAYMPFGDGPRACIGMHWYNVCVFADNNVTTCPSCRSALGQAGGENGAGENAAPV